MFIAVFIAYKMVPIKVRTAELRQEVIDQAKAAGMRGDDRILAAILRKADEENLPVTEDNVKIHRTQSMISVDVDYTVPVDFPGYKYQWDFHHHAENPIF
ncbi:MAG TPA: hypothetical protein VF980_02540 [Thermoanaerobaculia bacterium]